MKLQNLLIIIIIIKKINPVRSKIVKIKKDTQIKNLNTITVIAPAIYNTLTVPNVITIIYKIITETIISNIITVIYKLTVIITKIIIVIVKKDTIYFTRIEATT